MKSNLMFFIELIVSFLPFVLFMILNAKANLKKENRNRQYVMPIIAFVYSIVLVFCLQRLSKVCMNLFLKLTELLEEAEVNSVGAFLRELYRSWGIYTALVLFNTSALAIYIIVKKILTMIFARINVEKTSFAGSIVRVFYTYDEIDDCWYVKQHYGQARTFVKAAYYGSTFISGLLMLVSCDLCMKNQIAAPFYPVFAVIIIGEIAFFLDGLEKNEGKFQVEVQADRSRHIALYPLLRKPLKELFGDKLSADGTTINPGGTTGNAIEDILMGLEKNGGHVGKNYVAFVRQRMESGLKPSADYVRCGYELAIGKSLLFNTPFYAKLSPYIFYAMNRELLMGRKVLIVLGQHGTEGDLLRWSRDGMQSVSNIPDLWRISILNEKRIHEDDVPDIGIISRSGVHDLDIHRNNLPFLHKVSFVIVIEPSKLITTAQIGLNLLIKCCGKEHALTFCSVDRNCDGLVDALSHILMTDITEVSATEYPHGMSSYMYWTAGDDYLQHRILPGISRCLGMGTEISMVALKNQVRKTVWYGGDAFPVLDAHWIAKQYYYDLLHYAQLSTNQETFDECFQVSFNMCDEYVRDYSFITVEDDRNNLFETRRNFATIAEKQGFVNVISSEYLLREYMADNTEIFTADSKAIPYITADYARTKRNAILSLCLLLCIDSVQEETLLRQLVMLNIDTKDPVIEVWKEICTIFSVDTETDQYGNQILTVLRKDGKKVQFEREKTLLFRREYNVESGKFESVYKIENDEFSRIILDDLQNASYIAEQENKDAYIGSELKGHVYQKYMPGQFFTLNGKYYEMVSTTSDNRILVRRASEYIGGRIAYRQIRKYRICSLEDSPFMGTLKSINNIGIHYQFADFSVETPGYWKLRARNDFDNGDMVKVNGVPTRDYHHKQVLKLDFSKFGEAFTASIRMTLTNLLNEVFVTLFADNQPFISAVTEGNYNAPLTYSLEVAEDIQNTDKCIYIIEDSQLDIGLLIAVERNMNRILQIIADYLDWNEEKIEENVQINDISEKENEQAQFSVYEENHPEDKRGVIGRVIDRLKLLIEKRKKKDKEATEEKLVEEEAAADTVEEDISNEEDVFEKEVTSDEEDVFEEEVTSNEEDVFEEEGVSKENVAAGENHIEEVTTEEFDAQEPLEEDFFAKIVEEERDDE